MRTPPQEVYNAIAALREKTWAFSTFIDYLKGEYEQILTYIIEVKDEFDFKQLQGQARCLKEIISILENPND